MPPPPAAPRVEPDTTAPVGLRCEDLAEGILAAGTSRRELREAYGEPDSVEVGTQPNRHLPTRTDSLFTVRYPGLTVKLLKPEGGSDLTVLAEVRDNRYLRHPAIGIGAPAARVVSALGEPRLRREDRLVYECGMGAEQPVTFWLQNGTVSRVEVDYYVD